MIKNTVAIMILVFINTLLISQNYTEIEDFGFGTSIQLQSQIIYDIDNDGLYDLLQRDPDHNFLHFEQSISNPEYFELSTQNPFSNLEWMHSTFTDIDNDDLLDMFDSHNGYIHHYEQSEPNSYIFELINSNFNNLFLSDNWSYSTPSFFDIDNDNLLNMFMYVSHYIEEYPGQGYYEIFYYHYEQSETNSINFNLINDDMLGDISSGYRGSPIFTDIDNDNLLDMFLRKTGYKIAHFEQTTENSYDIELITNYFNEIDLGDSFDFTFIDIDSNNLLDLVISKGSDKLQKFEQETINSYTFLETNKIQTNIIDVGNRSFPTLSDINNDGLLDLLIGNGDYDNNYESLLYHYQQIESGTFEFELITDNFNNIGGNNFCGPNLFDIDNDGLLDLLISNYGGAFTHYEQSSINSYSFDFVGENFSNINEGFYSTTAFADIDNDYLLDLLIGDFAGQLHHYEQSSNNPYWFVLISSNFNGIDVGNRSKPHFNDIDNDSLWDLFIGCERGWVYHYEQVSLNSSDFELIEEQVNNIDVGYSSVPLFYDFNQNGHDDLLTGSVWGGLYLYSNNPVSVEDDFLEQNKTILLKNYPNPFNPSTKISFSINEESNVNLTIYNTKGQKIMEVANNVFDEGNHSIMWKGVDELGNSVSSGVYLYKLNVNGKTESVKKCILMK